MSPGSAPGELGPAQAGRPIPLPLVRDLVAVSLLTEDPRPPVRLRLERALGAELSARLLGQDAAVRDAA